MATMATKEDVYELRAELHAEIRAEHDRIASEIQLSIWTTLFCAIVGGGGFLLALYSLLYLR